MGVNNSFESPLQNFRLGAQRKTDVSVAIASENGAWDHEDTSLFEDFVGKRFGT